jgi:hypothetical protein
MGHSPTSLIRWMGKDGWTAEQARRVLDHFGVPYTESQLRAVIKEGATGTMKWGPPADVSDAEAGELRRLRDAVLPPPKEG